MSKKGPEKNLQTLSEQIENELKGLNQGSLEEILEKDLNNFDISGEEPDEANVMDLRNAMIRVIMRLLLKNKLKELGVIKELDEFRKKKQPKETTNKSKDAKDAIILPFSKTIREIIYPNLKFNKKASNDDQ